jgi:hypothetical protein
MMGAQPALLSGIGSFTDFTASVIVALGRQVCAFLDCGGGDRHPLLAEESVRGLVPGAEI